MTLFGESHDQRISFASRKFRTCKANKEQWLSDAENTKWLGVYLTKMETIGKRLFEMHLSQFANLLLLLLLFAGSMRIIYKMLDKVFSNKQQI